MSNKQEVWKEQKGLNKLCTISDFNRVREVHGIQQAIFWMLEDTFANTWRGFWYRYYKKTVGGTTYHKRTLFWENPYEDRETKKVS